MAYLMALLPSAVFVVYGAATTFAHIYAARTYIPTVFWIVTIICSLIAAAYLFLAFFAAFRKSSIKNGIGCFAGAGLLAVLYILSMSFVFGADPYTVVSNNLGLACILFFTAIAAGIVSMACGAKRK